MYIHQDLIYSGLYLVNEECTGYSNCKVDTLTDSIDIVRDLNNRTTPNGREIVSDTGKVKHHGHKINY